MGDPDIFYPLFSVGTHADPSTYGEVGRYWNVYINDVLVQADSFSSGSGAEVSFGYKASASGIDLTLELDVETEQGQVEVSRESGYEYIKYVTLSILVYGKELVPNFPDEEM